MRCDSGALQGEAEQESETGSEMTGMFVNMAKATENNAKRLNFDMTIFHCMLWYYHFSILLFYSISTIFNEMVVKVQVKDMKVHFYSILASVTDLSSSCYRWMFLLPWIITKGVTAIFMDVFTYKAPLPWMPLWLSQKSLWRTTGDINAKLLMDWKTEQWWCPLTLKVF